MTFIGIDPAFRKNGFAIAIIDMTDRSVLFRHFKNGFLDFLSWLIHESPERAVITIENSNMQNVTFKLTGNGATDRKRSRDVGKNQATSQNTVDACRIYFPDSTFEVSPADKGKKWSEKEFAAVVRAENLTVYPDNYKGSQDERDALKIALMGKRLLLVRRSSGKIDCRKVA